MCSVDEESESVDGFLAAPLRRVRAIRRAGGVGLAEEEESSSGDECLPAVDRRLYLAPRRGGGTASSSEDDEDEGPASDGGSLLAEERKVYRLRPRARLVLLLSDAELTTRLISTGH